MSMNNGKVLNSASQTGLTELVGIGGGGEGGVDRQMDAWEAAANLHEGFLGDFGLGSVPIFIR